MCISFRFVRINKSSERSPLCSVKNKMIKAKGLFAVIFYDDCCSNCKCEVIYMVRADEEMFRMGCVPDYEQRVRWCKEVTAYVCAHLWTYKEWREEKGTEYLPWPLTDAGVKSRGSYSGCGAAVSSLITFSSSCEHGRTRTFWQSERWGLRNCSQPEEGIWDDQSKKVKGDIILPPVVL